IEAPRPFHIVPTDLKLPRWCKSWRLGGRGARRRRPTPAPDRSSRVPLLTCGYGKRPTQAPLGSRSFLAAANLPAPILALGRRLAPHRNNNQLGGDNNAPR